MNKKIVIAILVFLVVGFLAWLYFKPAKITTTQSTNDTAATADITISNFNFSPSSFTVNVGQKISVVNKDSVQHSLTSDDKSFDTRLLSTGREGSFTAPTVPGTYKFHCAPHPDMTGTLIVQ